MAKNLILMSGIPGSGKSTLLKKRCDVTKEVIVSRDAIRFSRLNDKDEYFANEDEVWKEYIATLKLFLTDDNCESVIADATHLNARAREKVLRPLEEILKTSNIDVYVLFVNTSLETALERNAQRKGRALVPESAIKNMHRSLQAPSEKEGYDYWGYIDSPVNMLFKKRG